MGNRSLPIIGTGRTRKCESRLKKKIDEKSGHTRSM
jgi:hypothetical protein